MMNMIESIFRWMGNLLHRMGEWCYDFADSVDFSKDEHENIEKGTI